MKRVLHLDSFSKLSDEAALAEAKRIIMVSKARWRQMADSFGIAEPLQGPDEFKEDCPFARSLLAIFRYARNVDVPEFIVRSAIDELLTLMFAGLANGVMALPAFDKMADKPWAMAWRIAELRLIYNSPDPTDTATFAHLMGIPAANIKREITERGFNNPNMVPSIIARALISKAVNASQDEEII